MAARIDGGAVADHWKRRAWLVPPANQDTLLMNLYQDGESFFFGDLTQYTKGYLQALIEEKEDTPMLVVEQEPPPAGKEYVHSMMYWMAINNHALLIQSRSLTAKNLEEYLGWLLRDRTTTINATGNVILQAEFDAGQVGGDLDDIREIIVGGATSTTAMAVDSREAPVEHVLETDAYKEIATRKPWRERALDVLKAVMTNEADVNQLLLSIPPGADLQVSVHIGYRTKQRRISRAPMQQALRNLPEGEIKAIGKTGQMSGTDIRLSYPARIETIGNLLVPNDVIRALREAYTYFVANGKIEAQ
jgi:hypothetical protein